MPKPLDGVESPKTDKEPLDMLKVEEPVAHRNDEEESKLLGYVMGRFYKMVSKRTQIDRFWQMYQMQFESLYIPYTDGRTRSNVPLEWAIIELFVSEAQSRKSVPTFEAVGGSDIPKEEVIKRVWESVRKKSFMDEELLKAEYLTAIFGTSMYLNNFEQKARVIQDPDFVNGKLIGVKKMLTQNEIQIKALDIRNVYFDERVTDYRDANDCIYIQYLTPEEAKAFAIEGGGWKNVDSLTTTTKANQAYWTNEERGMQNSGLIEFIHYYNKNSDRWVVVGNRQTINKDTFIPFAHKELPITPRQYGYNPHSLYGRGLCEALLNFKSQINTLNEMIMDGVKRSNNSMFAIGAGLTFDGESFGFNNTLVKFEGQLNDANFRELSGKPPDAAIFNYLRQLLSDIAIYVGIDPTAIVGQASSTAFETAVKQESALKRVNVVLQNRDMALKQVFKKHLQNIQQFFPVKTAKGLLEINDDGKTVPGKEEHPSIILEGEKYVNGEFIQFDGKFPFEVKPEYIRGQIDVEVSTNFNAPTLRQLKRQNLQDFVRMANELTTAMQMNPALSNVIKVDDFIKQSAMDYDIDIGSIGGFKDDVSHQANDLLSKVRQMVGAEGEGGLPDPNAPQTPAAPGQPGQDQANTLLPNVGADVKAGKLPAVSAPATPNINNI
jgi:hypothetical protein